MPTYEYACEACGHTFEQVQPMTAKPLKKCPACGKLMLERLVSGGSGFILKGAGFWRNDSKSRKGGGSSSPSNAAAKTSSEGSDARETKDSKPTDSNPSKPAEKPAQKPAEKPADSKGSKPSDKPKSS
ncbi:MAG TPA: FmdB family zinc ribbon protein [Planctomycetota bacterium]|nr:FmdB family zinc ribbon protein [Planctomycetota bacterium]